MGCKDGRFRIVAEGRRGKFVGDVEQICYNAPFAEREGRHALFVTERRVFRAVSGTLVVIEIAPGIDLRGDVLDRTAFRPGVSPDLRPMDPRLFDPAPMGLRHDLALSPQARTPRRTVPA